MTTVKVHQEFTSNAGTPMFVEQYHDKEFPESVWFWRYGAYTTQGESRMPIVISSMLMSKPSKKRLMNSF